MKPDIPIRKHANQLASVLLRRFAFEATRAAKPGNSEAVHDLRVSIRRLAHCLRLFGKFFPHGKAKAIRGELQELMRQAAVVRNRDVALELLERAGMRPASPVIAKLKREREREHRLLREVLRVWTRSGAFKRWRSQLEL